MRNELTLLERVLSLMRELGGEPEAPIELVPRTLRFIWEWEGEGAFVGYAAKEDDTHFRVVQTEGLPERSLMGETFSLGEGLLGQAATSRRFGLWEVLRRDPRALFFTRRDVEPKLVYAAPILSGSTPEGILFGGSVTNATLPADLRELIETAAGLLGLQFGCRTLEAERNASFLRLTTLMDALRTISQAEDARRVLYLLIDLSVNLAEARFSAVALRRADGTLHIVSRGLTQEETGHYLERLTKTYGADASTVGGPGQPVWNGRDRASVLECPLEYGSEFVGVFTIAFQKPGDREEYGDFMRCMTMIAAAGLYRLTRQGDAGRSDVAETLRQSLRQWSPDAYAASERALDIAAACAHEHGLPAASASDLADACRLAPFAPDVLAGSAVRPAVLVLLRELQPLRAGSPHRVRPLEPAGELAQLTALAWLHAEGAALPEPADRRFDAALVARFRTCARRCQVVELGELETAAAAVPSEGPLERVKALRVLSARELEVVALVIAGGSNREIGEKLWISEHTVKNHMTNIFAKLDVTDRTHLVAKVYQLGY